MISFSDEMDTKVEVVQSIGDTFIRVLTKCRHRVRPRYQWNFHYLSLRTTLNQLYLPEEKIMQTYFGLQYK